MGTLDVRRFLVEVRGSVPSDLGPRVGIGKGVGLQGWYTYCLEPDLGRGLLHFGRRRENG